MGDDAGRRAFVASQNVSRETIERLDAFAALLVKWSRAHNLVAPSTIASLWIRHFLDSAQLFDLAPDSAQSWVDLGAGGGFPGLVIAAIAAERRAAMEIALIESDARKCSFLVSAAREMGVSIKVERRRIESPPSRRYDVVSARALAPLTRLLTLGAPYVSENGMMIFLKGRRVDEEIAAVRADWRIDHQLHASIVDPSGCVVVIDHARRRRND